MTHRGCLILLGALSITAGGCGNDPISSRQPQPYPIGTFVDQPAVLEIGEPVDAVRVGEDKYAFELPEMHPLLRGPMHYNDVELTYWAGSTCDQDVWVFDCGRRSWDQVGFFYAPYECRPTIWKMHHLLSARGTEARDCISQDGLLTMRGGYWDPPYYVFSARPLKINHNYFSVPLLRGGRVDCSALACGDKSLWVSSYEPMALSNISLSGEVVAQIETTSLVFGLAFDGENLWVGQYKGRISKISASGEVLCEFSVVWDFPECLTWGTGRLWAAVPDASEGRILAIDAEASCEIGDAVITKALPIPGGGVRGIAFTGSGFLLAQGETLRVYELDGTLVEEFSFAARNIRDVAWDGQALWALNDGPKGLASDDQVASRFRLR